MSEKEIEVNENEVEVNEKEVKLRKDGLPKQPLTVFEKIVIAISVILIILTAAVGTVKYGFHKLEGISTIITESLTKKEDKEPVVIDKRIAKIANYLMPDKIELENGDGVKFDVKVEVNENFTSEGATNLLDYFNVLKVYDWEGNELGNEDKIQKYDITGAQLKIMALMKIGDKLSKVKSTTNNVLIVLILLDIIAAVFITYFIWRRADDRRELRELQMREREIQRVTGLSEEEVKQRKKKKKKKK